MKVSGRLINAIIDQRRESSLLRSRKVYERTAFANATQLAGNSSIKVITGPRRAGKSTFALQLISFLSKAEDFIYLNFDDQALIETESHQDLNAAIDEVYGARERAARPRCILLDEIQNLEKWELWLNYLHRNGDNVIVTGSNANLLSRELSTHLTGRVTEIEILPFSFLEFSNAGGTFETFFEAGGFPDILFNAQDKRTYIEGLKNSVILKDIIQRYKIRNSIKLEACFDLLMSNPASLLSYKRIAQTLAVQSETTVRNYLNHLSNSYLFFELFPFSFKAKTFYRSPKKGYLIDNAFIDLNPLAASENLSKKLENLVFLELVKSGLVPNKSLFYYKTKSNLEVDFVIKKQLEIQKLIQVSYSIKSLETRERELRALVAASKELRVKDLQIVTWEERERLVVDDCSISVVPIRDFLTRSVVSAPSD